VEISGGSVFVFFLNSDRVGGFQVALTATGKVYNCCTIDLAGSVCLRSRLEPQDGDILQDHRVHIVKWRKW